MTDKSNDDVCEWTYHERHYDDWYLSWYSMSCCASANAVGDEAERVTVCPYCDKPIKRVEAEE